eukprot:1781796-Amphidinium_carterae.1
MPSCEVGLKNCALPFWHVVQQLLSEKLRSLVVDVLVLDKVVLLSDVALEELVTVVVSTHVTAELPSQLGSSPEPIDCDPCAKG